MNKCDYFSKMNNMFSDATTYKQLQTDPTKKQSNEIKKLIKEITKSKSPLTDPIKSLIDNDPSIARAYGLPKVHKPDTPLRIIVSLIGSPTYKIAKWLFRKLKHLITESDYSISNTTQFLDRIKDKIIDNDECFISFDVTSLFPSIPISLAENTINDLLTENPCDIGTADLMKLLHICLNNYCVFDGKYYHQEKGTPMGSPISGLVAEAVLQNLEKQVFNTLKPKLWLRYVDDTFVILKKDSLSDFHNLINSIFTDIQFTCEEAQNDCLPFLDVLINRLPCGSLQTSVYRKDINADVILNYSSNHPISHKRSCVKTLFKRAHTHSSDQNLLKIELEYLYQTFEDNGYPKKFIRECLRKRTNPPTEGNITQNETRWFSLPYIRGTSETVARHLSKLNIGVAHKPSATLRSELVKIKDKVPIQHKKGVVYQIPCSGCSSFYNGQTGKQLGTRIHEHQLCIRRRDHLSQVAMHTFETGHKFDWDQTKIIGTSSSRRGREFIEAWYSDLNSLNRHVDLDNSYLCLKNNTS
jgi:hypothetical protein